MVWLLEGRMEQAILDYKIALNKLKKAESKLEELRSLCMPNLTTKIILETDKDGTPTNWQNIFTTDVTIKKQFKSFQNQIETVVNLGVAANIARNKMLKEIEF